ncbi:MAG: asparagine synthase (glutamine-hydrolyzing) [Planctomycetota bacterium]|nr:asparagine synthase (glutamine-hydrolyzing) [Planctomycetota bacterium]
MCGFAGEFVFGEGLADLTVVRAMTARLVHRGPDQEGFLLSPDGRCGLGVRRLAVLDVETSRQPMATPDGQVAVAFNGEIYNYRDLRAQLRVDYPFQTNGDTEVLLPLYIKRGEEMAPALEGMFAFALYDARRRCLLLGRDRMGKKPLWFALLEDRIVFASEAKALLAHPKIHPSVNHQAIVSYLYMGYVPGPVSMFQGLYKLPPATTMLVDRSVQEPRRYWSVQPARMPPWRDKMFNRTREAVVDAVATRMNSDVKLGALLSGGVDSAVIVALMAKAAGKGAGVPTFTAGFADADYDERPAAAEIAAFCRTDHTDLLVDTPTGDCVDRIVDMYDEPFGDSSALPTFLICQAARQYVTVALCGDGGDEAFAGYDRYRAMHLAATIGPIKYLTIRLASLLARTVASSDETNKLRRLIRFASGLPYPPSMQYFTYRRIMPAALLGQLLTDEFAASVDLDATSRWFCELYDVDEPWDTELALAQRHDIMTYLPDDLLVKADIASMASSLELRSPFLDHQVVSWGINLPAEQKIDKHGAKKIMLRHLFGNMLPASVFQRRKHGFAAPIGRWLRGPLLPTMKETLLDRRLADTGLFRRETILRMISDHLHGRAELGHPLWALMVLAKWLARYS